MDTEFKGKKFKLVGFEVRQKGTLIDVFAKFAKLDQSLKDVTEPVNAQEILDEIDKNHTPDPQNPIDFAPTPDWLFSPKLSTDQIVEALTGPKEVDTGRIDFREFSNNSDVINDLGKEKLALLLIEMGHAKKEAMEDGISQVLPIQRRPKP